MTAMSTFPTLLKREWMQHRLGWWLLGAVPLAVMVPLMLFGEIRMGNDRPSSPETVALMIGAGYTFFVMVLVLGAVAIQAPGLARRDQQDRSIEFWLSLPIGHVPALGATLLMHWVLLPLLALGLAAAGGVVAALIAVVRVNGVDALVHMEGAAMLMLWLAITARMALGVVLGALWLSPFLVGGMAASAWLKRWGVPVVGGGLILVAALMANVYDQPWLLDQMAAQLEHFGWAVVPSQQGNDDIDQIPFPAEGVPVLGSWLWQDTLLALGDLVSVRFLAGLAIAGAGFALLVWKRRRG